LAAVQQLRHPRPHRLGRRHVSRRCGARGHHPGEGFTGAFTRLGGYDSTFDSGFATSVDVYIDLSDPPWLLRRMDLISGTAVNNQSGGHRRDFIFHAAADDNSNPGAVLIAGSNNSNFAKRNDLETLNHYAVTASGWYTFQWVFRDFGDGTLAVDLNLRDSGGELLWIETRHNATDVIATQIGGHRYMWFTFVAVDELAIDNTTAGFGSAFATDDCDPAPAVTYSDSEAPGSCPRNASSPEPGPRPTPAATRQPARRSSPSQTPRSRCSPTRRPTSPSSAMNPPSPRCLRHDQRRRHDRL